MNYGHCNPHGIDTILNRRTAAAAQAALNSLTSSAAANNTINNTSASSNNAAPNNDSCAVTAASTVNPYFKLEDFQAAAQAAAQVAQQRPNSAASNLYWPGIQGLISNPNLWRDRFNGKNDSKF